MSLFAKRQSGRADSMRKYLDSGIDVNETHEGGTTVLMHMALLGETDVVKVLLDYGAHVNARDEKGRTALMYAEFAGHRKVVRILEDAGAERYRSKKEDDK